MSNSELRAADFVSRGSSVRALLEDLRLNRLPNAVLMCGASGVGKRTLADYLARALLCVSEGERPCGRCGACKRVLSGTHPDLLAPALTPRDKTIKIDHIRELLEQLSRHSLEGGRRVILLKNAERMTAQAQNSLLKSLEEAREGDWFLLTADQESAILPTIRSRCLTVRIPPFEEKRARSILIDEGIGDAAAERAAELCEGSLTRARELLADEEDERLRRMVYDTFLALQSAADAPAAENRLKDMKDHFDRLLSVLEREIRLISRARAGLCEMPAEASSVWQQAPLFGVGRALDHVLQAQRLRASNVNWQAVMNGLMQNIAEEVSTWRP